MQLFGFLQFLRAFHLIKPYFLVLLLSFIELLPTHQSLSSQEDSMAYGEFCGLL